LYYHAGNHLNVDSANPQWFEKQTPPRPSFFGMVFLNPHCGKNITNADHIAPKTQKIALNFPTYRRMRNNTLLLIIM
jgi:hypothetical protein